MMRIPTAVLEGGKIPRVIFSIHPHTNISDPQVIPSLMKKAYDMGQWSFDLPTLKHLKFFKELKSLTNDEKLIGIPHISAESGVSFLGKPLHQFEPKILSTLKKNLFLPDFIRFLPSIPFSSEVFTQKEIDRIQFDPLQFEKTISMLIPDGSLWVFMGEKYGDWLLALGRIDILKEMVFRIREKGLIPIFSAQWTTFSLPKAKPLDVAAFAIPINKKWGLFDHAQACYLVKKFDKPIISLNPLADGKLLKNAKEAFSFLFDELKIISAIVEISKEKEMSTLIEVLKKFPSFIPHKKT